MRWRLARITAKLINLAAVALLSLPKRTLEHLDVSKRIESTPLITPLLCERSIALLADFCVMKQPKENTSTSRCLKESREYTFNNSSIIDLRA